MLPAEDRQRVASTRGADDIGALQTEESGKHVQYVGRIFDDEDL